jgi:hypothetical protein
MSLSVAVAWILSVLLGEILLIGVIVEKASIPVRVVLTISYTLSMLYTCPTEDFVDTWHLIRGVRDHDKGGRRDDL